MWNLRVRIYFILSDRVPKAYCLLRLKVVEPDFQKMSVFTKLDELGWNCMESGDAHSFPKHFNPELFRAASPKLPYCLQ